MEIPLDEVVYFDCITSSPTTGAATDADSTPSFEVFEEATDTDIGVGGSFTKRTSKTGNYRCSFTLSAANGFEVGKWYSVVASATVGGVAGKAAIKNFRCVAAEAVAGVPKVDVADWLGSTAPAMTGDAYARLGAPAGASVSADIAGVQADTDNIQTRLPAALVSGRMDSSVGAMAANTLTASALATDAATEIQTGLSTLDAAAVRAAVGLASANLDTQLSSIQSDTDNIQTRIPAALVSGRLDASVGAMAADVLTASALATDAVTEIQSGLSTLTAAGVRTAVGLSSANLDTQLSAIAAYIDTEVAAIKAKTDNLPTDPADASDIAASFSSIASTLSTIAAYIDTEVAAIKAKTDNLPASPADEATLATIASYIDTEVAAIKAKTDNLPTSPANEATLTTIASYIDTEVAAIKAKTDNLPSDPADASDVASSFSSIASTLSTIAGYIDTEVAAIKAKTDNLPAAPAAVGDIPVAAAISAAVVDQALSGHTTSGSVGAALNSASSSGDPWETALPGSYGDGTAGKIVAAIQTLLTTVAGYIDTEVAAIKAKTDNLPSDPADASDIAASFSSLSTSLSTITGYIDTEVAAIKAKTDLLPSSPAAVGSAMTLTSAYDAAMTAAQAVDVPTADQIALAVLTRKITYDSGTGEFVIWSADGTTEAQRLTPTRDSAALPIIGMEPSA